jgi:glycosyltransferase involved in cell wall biosynthesis
MKITAIILTYNEAHRIKTALTHALQWADEVCVVDKHSTDETRDIAESMGAKVHLIPFSLQGHEDVSQLHSFASNEWTWGFTPGEVPTRELVERAKELISMDVDCIMIPHKLYSFGKHSPMSPWSISYQPRLIRRDKVKFTGIAHEPIIAEKMQSIKYANDCHVLHQTHGQALHFIRVHADYAINEADNGSGKEVIARAMANFTNFDQRFSADPSITQQWVGWKLYWLMVALIAMDKDRKQDVVKEYAERAQEMLREQWNNEQPKS